jgi:hypothetical protein
MYAINPNETASLTGHQQQMIDTMGTIYGLLSTRDGKVRYVGKTDRNPDSRFSEHYWNDKRQCLPVYDWIARERWFGYDLDFAVLATCELIDLDDREAYWIARVPNLVNVRLARVGRSTAENTLVARTLTVIRNRKRAFVENWNGWIGIRHYPAIDAWQIRVQLPVPGRYKLLRGDGGSVFQTTDAFPGRFGRPSYRGDWYFSDPKTAIDARDQFRVEQDQYRRRYCGKPFSWPADDN